MDNPSSVPSFELPKNAEHDPGKVHNGEKDRSASQEANKEILPAPVQQNPSGTGMQVLPTDDSTVLPTTAIQGSMQVDDSHLIADDSDVIEKEWVDRAKKIIAATANDPFVEARELSKLKANYMSKRFNKELPLAKEDAK